MRCRIEVDGRPVPQGSMTASYNTRTKTAHVHHVQGAALAVWRATIREAAKATGVSQSLSPISMTVIFGMPRPKAHLDIRGGRYVVKYSHLYDRPAVAPDIDKLLRAVADALTGVCYHDDGQIVEVLVSKMYGHSTIIEVTDEAYRTGASTLGLGEVEAAGVDTG